MLIINIFMMYKGSNFIKAINITAADLCLIVIWNSWVGLENVNSGFTITGWTSHPVSNICEKLLLSLLYGWKYIISF